MSKWSEFRRGVRRATSRAVSKTGDLSDTASLHVKLARKEAFLADLYEQFGRIAYQKLKTGADVDRKLEILIEKIDITRSEMYTINHAIEEKAEAKKVARAAAEAEKAVHDAELKNEAHAAPKKADTPENTADTTNNT